MGNKESEKQKWQVTLELINRGKCNMYNLWYLVDIIPMTDALARSVFIAIGWYGFHGPLGYRMNNA